MPMKDPELKARFATMSTFTLACSGEPVGLKKVLRIWDPCSAASVTFTRPETKPPTAPMRFMSVASTGPAIAFMAMVNPSASASNPDRGNCSPALLGTTMRTELPAGISPRRDSSTVESLNELTANTSPKLDHTAKQEGDPETKPASSVRDKTSPRSKTIYGENSRKTFVASPEIVGLKSNDTNEKAPIGSGGPSVTAAHPSVDRVRYSVFTLMPTIGIVTPKLAGITTSTISPSLIIWPSPTVRVTVVRGQYAVQTAVNLLPPVDGYPADLAGPVNPSSEISRR
eukprot:720410-Rhodomonas_salina.1